jgi:hypothetical protein
MSWCYGLERIVIHSDIVIMKVQNPSPCESRLIRKQDVSHKLCVYKVFCEKPLTKHRPCTIVRRSEYVVWVKWLLMDNSQDKGNTVTFSSCNSSHIGSGVFFYFSQYVAFSKTRPYLTYVMLTGMFFSFKWVLYPIKACTPFFNSLYSSSIYTRLARSQWKHRACACYI